MGLTLLQLCQNYMYSYVFESVKFYWLEAPVNVLR